MWGIATCVRGDGGTNRGNCEGGERRSQAVSDNEGDRRTKGVTSITHLILVWLSRVVCLARGARATDEGAGVLAYVFDLRFNLAVRICAESEVLDRPTHVCIARCRFTL